MWSEYIFTNNAVDKTGLIKAMVSLTLHLKYEYRDFVDLDNELLLIRYNIIVLRNSDSSFIWYLQLRVNHRTGYRAFNCF